MPQELLPLASISDYKASHERALSRDRVDAAGGVGFRSRSHDAVIRVYDEAGNVIETHEHAGEFKDS
jgi:hypothetical protein